MALEGCRQSQAFNSVDHDLSRYFRYFYAASSWPRLGFAGECTSSCWAVALFCPTTRGLPVAGIGAPASWGSLYPGHPCHWIVSLSVIPWSAWLRNAHSTCSARSPHMPHMSALTATGLSKEQTKVGKHGKPSCVYERIEANLSVCIWDKD
ncbi:hypothetical protein K505DRAFT_39028 [Melanomma pulvis-pyrius CBS 109.77]|uniref:Uncharacterized protein n=1 Tax=Melanomma pulvis-pyrius CBS 109.77 TaxID=1314802 RepID=A0A6A6XAM2_9PLEO|nr:hypothetical protein K505DRAFT_39028 [Melanomma pulvis-pyrius CBS 109.77]